MPTRRQFLHSLGLGAAAAMLPRPSAAADERPNILYIMSDDHAAPAISAYDGFLAKAAPTPNIDRIAREGMLFRNCLVTNSICTPSRAAIFTGKYAHKNGVYKFTALDQSQPTLPKLMQAAGGLDPKRSLKGYLLQLTRNASIDHLRRRSRRPPGRSSRRRPLSRSGRGPSLPRSPVTGPSCRKACPRSGRTMGSKFLWVKFWVQSGGCWSLLAY